MNNTPVAAIVCCVLIVILPIAFGLIWSLTHPDTNVDETSTQSTRPVVSSNADILSQNDVQSLNTQYILKNLTTTHKKGMAVLQQKYGEHVFLRPETIPCFCHTPAYYLLYYIGLNPKILDYPFDFNIINLLNVKIPVTADIAKELSIVTGANVDRWIEKQKLYNIKYVQYLQFAAKSQSMIQKHLQR